MLYEVITLAGLLKSDSISIRSNLSFHNLGPLSTYLGKPGSPAKGGLPLEEYEDRQNQHVITSYSIHYTKLYDATTRPMDLAVLYLLLSQLLLGLYSITVSAQHRDGAEMLKLVFWAQHIVTFRGDAASYNFV